MSNYAWLFIVVFLYALPCAKAQQYNSHWDAQIARHEAEGQADSVIFYYRLKANYYKQVDSLEAWTYCFYECQFLYSDDKRALSFLDTAIQKKWRRPRTAAEAEAIALVQASRGFYLFNSGNILGAIQAQEEGLHFYNKYKFKDFDALEYFFKPLIANYTRIGDNEKARVIFQMAMKGDPSRGKSAAFAGLYNNIGLTYWNEGDNETAISYYRQGLYCLSAEPEKTALLLSSLAVSLLETGKLQDADVHLEKSIALLEKMTTRKDNSETVFDYLSGAYLTKARLLRQQARNNEAHRYLQRALAAGKKARASLSHRDIAKIWIEFGAWRLQNGHPDNAITAYNEALSAVIPSFKGSSPADLPLPETLYPENAIYEALEGKADALTLLYVRTGKREWLLTALICHQLAAHAEVLLRHELQYESAKLGILAQSRRRTEKAIHTARQLYQLTGISTYLYAAWTFAEQAKAVLLLEAIQRSRLQQKQVYNDTLLSKELRLRQQLAYFERELLLYPNSHLRSEWQLQRNALMDKLEVIDQELDVRFPDWRNLSKSTDAFTATDIANMRTTLPNFTIVEYFVGENDIHIFYQSPHGKTNWQVFASPDTLKMQVQELLALLQSRTAMQTPGTYLDIAHQVYQKVLTPLITHFEGYSRNLLIIPDAWLSFLPFEALLIAPATSNSWSEAPFLFKKYIVHYAFSLAVMESQRRLTSGAAFNLLQLAPRFQQKQRGLPPLMAGKAETLRGSRLLLDEGANWENLSKQAPEYRIVHLSTHAGVDSTGALPRVELFDRTIYLPDIYALNLHADLVVLSACQTALGQFEQGEGIMSLSRAFAFAGAKGLVASLWTINEAATAKILRHMYEHLAAGAPKPRALHQAKLDYLNDPAVPAFQKSPYYWAALTYVGDNGSVKMEGRHGVWFALFALLLLTGIAGVIWYRRRR